MFKSIMNRGFQITFENGWTISVQWGTMNYCENRFAGKFDESMKVEDGIWESSTAEIAIWKDKFDYTFEDSKDIVRGYCTANDVAEWIAKVSNFNTSQQ